MHPYFHIVLYCRLIAKWDKTQLVLVATGKGDFSEFKANMDPKAVNFGVYKVYGVDEHESVTSKRDKLVQITVVGSGVSPLGRNAVLNSKGARVSTFSGCVTEFQTDDDDLSEREICKQLLASGGAHKPTHYQLGTVKVPLNEL
jgi:hypothetical protein